jgi:hypothetical protein
VSAFIKSFSAAVAFCCFIGAAFTQEAARDAEWCLTTATKRIKDQSMRANYCPRYVLGWATHHQNDLARDAINAIVCENNMSRAMDYLRVCQCHNPHAHDNIDGSAGELEVWARRRAPEIGLVCPPPPPPPVPPTLQPLNAACICEYGNGQVAAWFTYKPNSYGNFGLIDVAAFQCQNLSVCERFQSPNGYFYKTYTGRRNLSIVQWTEQLNLQTGYQSYSAWGQFQ